MEGYRADAPLGIGAAGPGAVKMAKPYCFTYDNWGPPGASARPFEYQYANNGVRLWPHIPPVLSRYAQKIPSYFGKTKMFLAATGSDAVTGVLVNGKAAKMTPTAPSPESGRTPGR